MSAGTRAKDASMAKHLAPAPKTHRVNPDRWPYHNNLGTSHKGKVRKLLNKEKANG